MGHLNNPLVPGSLRRSQLHERSRDPPSPRSRPRPARPPGPLPPGPARADRRAPGPRATGPGGGGPGRGRPRSRRLSRSSRFGDHGQSERRREIPCPQYPRADERPEGGIRPRPSGLRHTHQSLQAGSGRGSIWRKLQIDLQIGKYHSQCGCRSFTIRILGNLADKYFPGSGPKWQTMHGDGLVPLAPIVGFHSASPTCANEPNPAIMAGPSSKGPRKM
jgi:hypothetical protein